MAKTSILFLSFAWVPGLVVMLTLKSDSGDVKLQDLMTLVQQQGKVIEQQAAALTALQDQMRDLTSQVGQQASFLTGLTQGRETRQVSFTARMNEVEVELTSSPFVFGSVVSNVGGGYDSATGIFTTPVAGLYVFYAQVMNHANSSRVDWGIFTPTGMLCLSGLDFAPAAYDKASCLATAHLDKGQQAFVRRSSAGGTIEGNVYTSFSGFLLSAADP